MFEMKAARAMVMRLLGCGIDIAGCDRRLCKICFGAHVGEFECFVEPWLWLEVLVRFEVLCLCDQLFSHKPDRDVETLHGIISFNTGQRECAGCEELTVELDRQQHFIRDGYYTNNHSSAHPHHHS